MKEKNHSILTSIPLTKKQRNLIAINYFEYFLGSYILTIFLLMIIVWNNVNVIVTYLVPSVFSAYAASFLLIYLRLLYPRKQYS